MGGPCPQCGKQGLSNAKLAGQIDVELTLKLLDGHILQGPGQRLPCVVDQAEQGSGTDDFGRCDTNRFIIGEIEGKRPDPAAELSPQPRSSQLGSEW